MIREAESQTIYEKPCFSFSLFFLWFFGQNRSQDLRGPQLIILAKYGGPPTTPDPFHAHFTFLFFQQKKRFLLSSIFELFLICSWCSELWQLRDHSQIVDLAERIRMVASRASETSKVPHSWQNNVQNVSQTNMNNSDIKNKMVIVPLEFTGRRKGVT